MKNYATDKDDKNRFILNYKIEEDLVGEKKIVLNLANGEEYVISYCKENEKKVLEQMKKQLTNSEDIHEKLNDKGVNCIPLIAVDLVLAGCPLIYVLNLYYLLGIPGLLLLKNVLKMIILKRKLNDLDKNELFLENENLFVKENMKINTSNGLSKKAKNLISKNGTITLNDLDNLSYDDLLTLIENIKRDIEFGFDYEPKKLIKK